jgi:hypothetical protein
MKFDRTGLALFALIVVGLVSLGLLADAGHVFWPIILIVAGAYIVPTLFLKLRNFYLGHRISPTRDSKDRR